MCLFVFTPLVVLSVSWLKKYIFGVITPNLFLQEYQNYFSRHISTCILSRLLKVNISKTDFPTCPTPSSSLQLPQSFLPQHQHLHSLSCQAKCGIILHLTPLCTKYCYLHEKHLEPNAFHHDCWYHPDKQSWWLPCNHLLTDIWLIATIFWLHLEFNNLFLEVRT